MPTTRALTVSIQKGLIYVMLGEKDIYSDSEEKHSEKICKDTLSQTDPYLYIFTQT